MIMLISKNDTLEEQVYANIRGAVVKDRSGIHISDLIYCLRKAYFRKMKLSPPPSNELCLLWLTGYSFQAYMFPSDKEITSIVDGVNCTPDIPTGIEVKSTRQSVRNFDFSTNIGWQRQILGYCKALGKLEYDLVVMFVCGNYAPPFPSIGCWHICVEQEEVDANWSNVIEGKHLLESALESGIPPEPACQDWEWEYCENVEMCEDTACFRKWKLKQDGKKK
jgi:hypothetical protein